jgi:hypothetical protein
VYVIDFLFALNFEQQIETIVGLSCCVRVYPLYSTTSIVIVTHSTHLSCSLLDYAVSLLWLQVLRKKQLFRLRAVETRHRCRQQFTPSPLQADHLTKNLCIIYTVMICVTFLLLPSRDAEFPLVRMQKHLYILLSSCMELPNALCVNMCHEHTDRCCFIILSRCRCRIFCKIHTRSLLHKLSLCASSARVIVGL